MRRLGTAGLGVLMLAAGACGGTSTTRAPAPTAPTIADRHWTLVSVGERSDLIGSEGRPPTLRLDAATARASGFAGCNRFTATYVLDGDRLTFGPIASTRRACPDGMDVERSFVAALADVTTYQVAGTTLTLAGAAGPLARFRTP
jgi:heat shock protein HslJ